MCITAHNRGASVVETENVLHLEEHHHIQTEDNPKEKIKTLHFRV